MSTASLSAVVAALSVGLMSDAIVTAAAPPAAAPAAAAGQGVGRPGPFDCSTEVTSAGGQDSAETTLKPSGLNTAWYDHYYLRPACGRPLVLFVKDGEYFQIVIGNTDSTLFSYVVTAIPDQPVPTSTVGATGAGREPQRFEHTAVAMRHSKAFARYRLTIALREDLRPQPERARPSDAAGAGPGAAPRTTTESPLMLYPAVFDVWVKTRASFEVAFTGGFAASTLRSPQYFIRTDDKGTPDAADDTKTVEEDLDAKDGFRPDIIAIANLRFPDRWKGVGLAFGVGLNNDSDPRYFAGPSLFLGRHFLLHAGWTGGRVDRLPNGQELDKPPISGDNTLTNLPKKFAHGFYVSLGFAFVPGAEDAFKGAFGSGQKTAPPAPPTTESPTEVDLTGLAGTYESADKVQKAEAKITGQALEVTITVAPGGNSDVPPGKRNLSRTEGLTFATADEKTTCVFDRGDSSLECQEDGKKFQGTKVATP